jgi:mannonate dehydratase
MKLMDHLYYEAITAEGLDFFKAIGVDCLLSHMPEEVADGRDPTEEFRRMRSFVEDHGLELFCLHSHRVPRDKIIHGLPGREQELENWFKVIRALGAAGIPATATTFYAIGHFRTPATSGRGGATYSTFDYEEYQKDPKDFPDLHIDADHLWDNVQWWVERIAPVAEEAGVRIALHPDDPPFEEPLGGAARIVTSIENYQRIFSYAPGPGLGMLFCQGCVAEMGEDVPAAIRTMAQADKIVFVHFRNIRGVDDIRAGRYRFQEVFIDEGDVDMLAAMQSYKDAGYTGPFMMDHTPGIPGATGEGPGRAYANGYIRAALQMVYGRAAAR